MLAGDPQAHAAAAAMLLGTDPDTMGAPDLAVEVVSPNDTSSKVVEKAFAWIAAPTRRRG